MNLSETLMKFIRAIQDGGPMDTTELPKSEHQKAANVMFRDIYNKIAVVNKSLEEVIAEIEKLRSVKEKKSWRQD